MAIGILALGIGIVCLAVSTAGKDEKPMPKERTINYPYPKEI